jgi:hypothetical protein
MTTLSDEKVKKYIINRIARGKWIPIWELPNIKSTQINEVREIIKQMIRDHDYEGENIYIELDREYARFKIVDKSGFKKFKRSKDETRKTKGTDR